MPRSLAKTKVSGYARVPDSHWTWLKKQFADTRTYEHLPMGDGSRRLRLYGLNEQGMFQLKVRLIREDIPFDLHRASDGEFHCKRFHRDGTCFTKTYSKKPDAIPLWENQEENFKRYQLMQLLDS